MKTKKRDLEIKVKNLLWLRGLDVAKLARLIKKSRPWTSQVLYGHAKSEATRKAIARALGEYPWADHKSRKAA